MAPSNQGQGTGNQRINTEIATQLQAQLGQVTDAATAMEVTRNVLRNAQANGVTAQQALSLIDETYQGSSARQ